MEFRTFPTPINYNNIYVEYIKRTLTEQGITYQDVFELGYELTEYQGLLLILITTDDPDRLDRIAENEWNMGDDSYTISRTQKEHYYLIDICQ